jgi:hypothetical protein
MLALWTGQRQGDLLRLPWSAYDGSKIKLKQSKSGRNLLIPVSRPLKALLDQTSHRSTQIMTNTYGQPWTSDGFRASWRKLCAKAKVRGLTFHDLRGSAVMRLAMADATVPEIATFTGHSLMDVESILDAHYLGRDVKARGKGNQETRKERKASEIANDEFVFSIPIHIKLSCWRQHTRLSLSQDGTKSRPTPDVIVSYEQVSTVAFQWPNEGKKKAERGQNWD